MLSLLPVTLLKVNNYFREFNLLFVITQSIENPSLSLGINLLVTSTKPSI